MRRLSRKMPPSTQGHECVRAIIKLMILEFRLGRAWPNRRRPHSLCPSACHVARLAKCHETLACHAVVLSSAAFERQSPRCTELVFDLSFNTCTHCGIQTLSDAFRGCVPFGVESKVTSKSWILSLNSSCFATLSDIPTPDSDCAPVDLKTIESSTRNKPRLRNEVVGNIDTNKPLSMKKLVS